MGTSPSVACRRCPHCVVYRLLAVDSLKGGALVVGEADPVLADEEEIIVGRFHWVGFAGGGHAKKNWMHVVASRPICRPPWVPLALGLALIRALAVVAASAFRCSAWAPAVHKSPRTSGKYLPSL